MSLPENETTAQPQIPRPAPISHVCSIEELEDFLQNPEATSSAKVSPDASALKRIRPDSASPASTLPQYVSTPEVEDIKMDQSPPEEGGRHRVAAPPYQGNNISEKNSAKPRGRGRTSQISVPKVILLKWRLKLCHGWHPSHLWRVKSSSSQGN